MIIPVLDLKNGIAVSGKSGERETYLPLKTVFHNSSSPLEIAMVLKEAGASRMYIADLDAIEGEGDNFQIVKDINKQHISVMLDCGASNVKDVKKALEAADKVIVATETLQNIEDLKQIFKRFSGDKIVISIDIKDGKIYSKYLNIKAEELIEIIKELEASEIILLDISRVGSESGVNEDLIRKFEGLKEHLIIGGGIIEKDIVQLEKAGLNKFLVGTALHKGIMKLNF